MQIAAEFDNIDSVKHAMEVNAAVAFLPRPSVQEHLADRTLVELSCPWLKLTRPLGVVHRRGSPLGRTARGVMELILSDSVAQSESTTCSLHHCDKGRDEQESSANANSYDVRPPARPLQ